ncbi:TRAP transporter substrate-binding protein [candidate division KSB1 bacterium]|nr:TRAP transporter substrate-binding protein [candidate division KSB1 bacterium]
MRRSLLFSVFLFGLNVVLSGCGQKSGVTNLKMAHGLDISHPVHKAMMFMRQRALALSDSTLVIDVYPNEQLGSEKECIELLQLGGLAMTKVSSSPLESFIDEYKVFALPFLFRSSEHRWKVLNGDIGKRILASGDRVGLRGLCYYDAGARSFYTKVKPILHPDDLKGLKIRTQQSPMAMKMIEALGGSATPIAWGELYTSLQQGVVDGAENNEPSLYTSNHYEVCKYYSLDEHTMVPDVVLISTEIWENLSPGHRQVLQDAADASVEFQRKVWASFVQESMEKMTAAGLEVYNPDKKSFIDRAQKVWKEFEGTVVGELADQIIKVE